ncbi:MAG: hypothetical protein BroJett007_13360 [Chloroflexota bacterium]|nr:MAG: hypothetical protein BroJett007_13360 [Chloroflexota bacterium]
MPMDPNQQKEQYSIAFVHTIASAAGYNIGEFKVDDFSVDCSINGYRDVALKYVPRLDLQLKCTAYENYKDNATIPFDLRQKNYNDLCASHVIVPRILVVVVVPDDPVRWHEHLEEQSITRYCAYWHSLRGEPPTDQSQKRIHLDRANVFNPNTLRSLMDTIGNGGTI